MAEHTSAEHRGAAAGEQSRPDLTRIAEAARARMEAWAAAGEGGGSAPRSHDLILGGGTAEGLGFTQRLLDLLLGGDDAFAAAEALRVVSREVPDRLAPRDRLVVRAGGAASLGLPWAVMPLAKRWLRDRIAHLVHVGRLPEHALGLDRRSRGPLYSGLIDLATQTEEAGLQLALAPTGERVLGPAAAEAELDRLGAIASMPEISRLVVDPARLVPGGSDWSATDDVVAAAAMVEALLEVCAEHGTALSLEATTYRWAMLTPEVLIRASADERFRGVRLGLRLPAELPQSRDLAQRILGWAEARAAEGGEPVEVVIGAAGLIHRERVASIRSGLAVAALEDVSEVDAQLLRLLDLVLRDGGTGLRAIIASEEPAVIAAGLEIAAGHDREAGVRLSSGLAPELARALPAAGVATSVLVPATTPEELGGLVEWLLVLAVEAAQRERIDGAGDGAGDGHGAATQDADDDPLVALVARSVEPFPESHRTQSRAREWHPSERDSALFYHPPGEPTGLPTAGLTAAVLGLGRSETGEITLERTARPQPIPVVTESGFANEPGTDASLAENREWARALIDNAPADAGATDGASEDGATVEAPREEAPGGAGAADGADDSADLEALIEGAQAAQGRWGAQPPRARGQRLRRSALAVAAARDRLTQLLVADTGDTIASIDQQICDLIDAARYSGQLAEGFAAVRGAEYVPGGLALIVADRDVTLAEQGHRVIAALAAGSAVIWVVPEVLRRSATALVDEWEAAGLPERTVTLLGTAVGSEAETWLMRLTHGVDRVTVLGDRALARGLQRRRPDLRVDGQLRTTGSATIMPSGSGADAVSDLISSAFLGPHAQRVHAAILVGRAGRSQEFRERLVDAARALRIGDTRAPGSGDPLAFDIAPLVMAPTEAGMRALTELGPGEEWALEPQCLDDAGLLWSPGIKTGVPLDATFWRDARGLPLLGIVRARTVAEAIRIHHRIGGGSHASLHSLDPTEIGPWLEQAHAASLSLNRPTTDVRVERQPVGGWDDAAIGLPALIGGPNQLVTLGSWRENPGTRSATLHLRGLDPEVRILIEAAQEVLAYEEFDEVRRAALSDALTWKTRLGLFEDSIGLGIERNAIRVWPVPTLLRLSEGGSLAQLMRVLAAALVARARVAVSTGEVLPAGVATFLASQGIAISLERDDDWLERLSVSGATDGRGLVLDRVRLIGGDRARVAEWMSGQDRLSLWAEPVTMAGPVELLSLLREQSISARAHRAGIAMPVPELDERLAIPGAV